MPREVTEIRVRERDPLDPLGERDEEHESWILVRANRVNGSRRLFDSEITHQHWIYVEISRAVRTRGLNRDWLHDSEMLMHFELSEAQWGAFVSSFGNGTGVPATLTHFNGERVPEFPHESRLDESVSEVRNAAKKATEKIEERFAELQEAFNSGAGKREMRQKIDNMSIAISHMPANAAFAAKSLNEHVENVVTKARADIEAMAMSTDRTNPFLTTGDQNKELTE